MCNEPTRGERYKKEVQNKNKNKNENKNENKILEPKWLAYQAVAHTEKAARLHMPVLKTSRKERLKAEWQKTAKKKKKSQTVFRV